jgi:hypothetical protein
MIEPFKEQLESFELEKKALLSQSEQAQGEVKKLAIQYGSLLGKPRTKEVSVFQSVQIGSLTGLVDQDPYFKIADPEYSRIRKIQYGSLLCKS